MQQGFIHAERLNGKVMKSEIFGRQRLAAGDQGTQGQKRYNTENGFHLPQDNRFPL